MTGTFGRYPSSLGVEPIRFYTRTLADIVAENPSTTAVPTAGDWTLADLAGHLTEVQDFWSGIIENRPAGPNEVADQPTNTNRASLDGFGDESRTRAGLSAGLIAANERLVASLSEAALDEPAWSWYGDLQTVEFTWRRQSHEALIHCFDGILAADAPWPEVDPKLAADGVDELFTVMAGGAPEWAETTASGERVLIEATDSGDRWALEFASLTGTSSRGTTYTDEPTTVQVDAEQPVMATIQGRAIDINLWAWGRIPFGCLQGSGDERLWQRLRELVAESTV